MSETKTDFWVGLFMLLGAAALVFLALRAGNMSSFSFASTYPLTASFDDVGGLKVRAPVKSAGVVVGRVGAINFDNASFQAVITLNIDSAYKFPKETSAAILTSGLLGEQYVGLTPGDPDGPSFAPGGKIRYTQGAIALEKLISTFLFNTASKQGTADAPNTPNAPAGGSGNTHP